jgi:hypothetical protein
MRRAATAAALIEQDGAVALRVEHLPHLRDATLAGAAVHHHGGLAGRVSAGLPVDSVAVTDVQHAMVVRLEWRVQISHSSGLGGQARLRGADSGAGR